MPLALLNNNRTFFSDVGSGPAALLLHGFTGSSADWRTVTPGLAGSRRIIAVDLPGHGQTGIPSDPRRFEIESTAADLITLLDRLALDQVDLLGYSMGGRLALFTALHYQLRVRTLVLESASPGLAEAAAREARRAADKALASRIEEEGIEMFVDYWASLPLWASQQRLPEEKIAALRQRRLSNCPKGLAGSLRGMGTGVQPSLWADLARLKRPTLLLAGREDEKFVAIATRMATALPQAKLALVPQAGHTIHLEQPEAFSRLVIDFWNQHG